MSFLAALVILCLAGVGIIWLLEWADATPGDDRPYDWKKDGI